MEVKVTSPLKLSGKELATWHDLHTELEAFQSPYFSPVFARLVAEVRPGARVGILRSGGEPIGFFPFQARAGGLGISIAGPLTDYEGVVAPPDFTYDARELIRACGLTVYDFVNIVAEQTAFQPYHDYADASQQIDLSKGYEAYVAEMHNVQTRIFADNAVKTRRIERRIGPIRFEFHDKDPRALDTLFKWKSEQYRRTGAIDSLAWPWTKGLLRRIYTTQAAEFAGMLSTLYVGDKLVAAHLGMRSAQVLHHWYPTYDVSLAKFSPGVMLLLRMVEGTAEMGLQTLDMGRGDYEFKRRLANKGVPLATGTVTAPALSWVTAMRLISRLMEQTFERLPLGRYSSVPHRGFRKIRTYLAYR